MEKPLMTAPQALIDAILLDLWPSSAVMTDFGLDLGGQLVYEAYYYPIRAGEITVEQLSKCLASDQSGKLLTELVNSTQSNPHPGIEIRTMWD